MNLHMPQDEEAASELRNLAAVPYQIVSPGNNTPIIGIYQDSMLGSFQFTREMLKYDENGTEHATIFTVNGEEFNNERA